VLDTDRFLAFMAMEVMVGHRDGYCLARNNYRVYHDLDTGKLVFFPHGMDQLLGTADLSWQPNMGGLVARAVMAASEGRKRYAASFGDLFTNVFMAGALTTRVDQLAQELQPFLRGGEWTRLRDESDAVKQRLLQRQLSLQSQLSHPPVKAPEFKAGIGQLDSWKVGHVPTQGRMDRLSHNGTASALHIVTGSDASASWVARALMSRGRYRFEGQTRVAGVEPLPYGIHHGAGLRIGGRPRQGDSLTGDSAWQLLSTEFEVEDATKEVEFICELRAAAGEAWFELNSLRVVQLFKP
jgi:hypothetical protein